MNAPDSPALFSLEILETVLSGNGSWGVTELAHRLEIPKGRAHRHLTLLRDAGYLHQSASTRRYEAGWRLILLGQRIDSRSIVVTMARPVMERLRDEVGQTVVLSQLTEVGVTVTEVLPGGSPIDVVLHPGTQFGYNSSAQGKVALAFAADDQKEQWSLLTSESRTASTVLDQERLWRQVEEIRRTGWGQAPGETYTGINTIAVPVLDHDGRIVATLAIVASVHYLPDTSPEETVSALMSAGQDLSTRLGHGTENPADAPASPTP